MAQLIPSRAFCNAYSRSTYEGDEAKLTRKYSAILESLKHRNIVQLIQKIKDPKKEHIYIVMEVDPHPLCPYRN